MTNGDKFKKEIVKKSNAGLAKILVNVSINNSCEYCIYNEKTCSSKCEYGIKAWFDAPCANEPEKQPADNKAEKLSKKVDEVFMRNRDKLLGIVEEIIKECKENYPNRCKGCFYSDLMGLCCFKDRPTTWGLEIADKGTQPDNVNHPAHYTSGQIEVIDFIEDQHLGFHLGNAVKYISRAGRKDPARTIEDLRKAAWYLNRQIQRLERAENE